MIPANIHAAAGLERILEITVNKRVWKSPHLQSKATKLLRDIEGGIRQHGVVKNKAGESVYAYEVDGKGGVLVECDDANVPSLLSIPLLGWSGYDHEVYTATRKMLLSPSTNKYYFDGTEFRGIGSPHAPSHYVWPMAFAVEALTEEGSTELVAHSMLFQIKQSLKSACGDAMHEGVDSRRGCNAKGGYSRAWFEWANALFVVLLESATGERCDGACRTLALKKAAESKEGGTSLIGKRFYQNKYKNDPNPTETNWSNRRDRLSPLTRADNISWLADKIKSIFSTISSFLRSRLLFRWLIAWGQLARPRCIMLLVRVNHGEFLCCIPDL